MTAHCSISPATACKPAPTAIAIPRDAFSASLASLSIAGLATLYDALVAAQWALEGVFNRPRTRTTPDAEDVLQDLLEANDERIAAIITELRGRTPEPGEERDWSRPLQAYAVAVMTILPHSAKPTTG